MADSSSVKVVLKKTADIMEEEFEFLSKLDAEMGDGDLGIYMKSGFRLASDNAEKMEGTPGELIKSAGTCMMDNAPSTLGTLVGVFLRKMGRAAGAAEDMDVQLFAKILEQGILEIEKRGGAKRGDKTILDTLWPACDAIKEDLAKGKNEAKTIFADAYSASLKGLEESTKLKAVFGRPAYFGEKTIGMQDGGATVGTLLFKALSESFSA